MGSVGKVLAAAFGIGWALVACSSHWSMDGESAPQAVALDAVGVEVLARAELVRGDEGGRMDCQALLVSLDLVWEGPATELLLDGELDTGSEGPIAVEDGGTVVSEGLVFEPAEDGGCRVEHVWSVSAPEGAEGALRLRVYASDASSAPNDEPEGELRLVVALEVGAPGA